MFKVAMQEQGENAGDGPHWLEKFLSFADDEAKPEECYFSDCDCPHPSSKHFFCISCEEGPLCGHKLSSKHGKQLGGAQQEVHEVLQTRKSSRMTAILKKDIELLVNVEDVQVYTINGDWVVYLNRPAGNYKRQCNAGSSAICVECGRGLVRERSDGYRFCCIACKKSCMATRREQFQGITLAPPAAGAVQTRPDPVQPLLPRKRRKVCAHRTSGSNASPVKKTPITHPVDYKLKDEARALTFFTDLDVVPKQSVNELGQSRTSGVLQLLDSIQIKCEDHKWLQVSLQNPLQDEQEDSSVTASDQNDSLELEDGVTSSEVESAEAWPLHETQAEGTLLLFV